VAYADGTDTSIDYNNKGRASAQPASVSILNICNGTSGVMTGPDASGYYTAQITDPLAGFPVGSKMRTIGLQGYFTQVSPALARHTISVVKNVTGDTVRRTVIDPAKCASCHEIFEGHGGNRNISAESTGINICVVCHNANLSSSGTTVNLTYEEATQNLKDMVHSIHAADVRTTPYIHYRAKGGSATKYDWSDVGFPGVISKCETCHVPGTYGAIPDGALATTDRVGSTATTPAGVTSLRNTVPNASDLITSPFTSTCIACHDSTLPTDHMTLQGGWIKGIRIP
jgi:OmcA/MtrC family decaheme c-type cytochrome